MAIKVTKRKEIVNEEFGRKNMGKAEVRQKSLAKCGKNGFGAIAADIGYFVTEEDFVLSFLWREDADMAEVLNVGHQMSKKMKIEKFATFNS